MQQELTNITADGDPSAMVDRSTDEAADGETPGDAASAAPDAAAAATGKTTTVGQEMLAVDAEEVAPPSATDISKRESLEAPEPQRTPDPGSMLHRWGLLGRLFARLFFSKVMFPQEDVEVVREAAKQGTVVYVMRLRSTFDFLYFNYAFMAHGLPLARFANGLRTFFWQPLRLILRRMFRRRPEPVETLRRLTRARRSTTVFLRCPALIGTSDFEGPYLRTLVDLQRSSSRPIVFVPLTVLWGKVKRPVRDMPSRIGLIDRVLGDQDEPRAFRRLLQLMWHARRSLAVVCRPLRLDAFLEQRDFGDDQEATGALEDELLERIECERRVRIGPRRAHFLEIRRQILELPQIRALCQQRAAESGKSLAQLRRQAARALKKMQAQMSSRGLFRVKWFIDRFWKRLFEGFEIDEGALARLPELARDGPLVYVPLHRSHADYLLMSELLYARGQLPPHIAAGENLSFWPLGWLFRGAGAFFLRRRYQGDALYGALLRAYVAALLREGHHLEVFIEGGRTRTGLVRHPKLGLLSVVADLAVAGELPPLHVVPVSIGYERLLELRAVTRELSGAGKTPESRSALLRAASLLRARRTFGFVNIQFHEPIDARAFLERRGYRSEQDSAPEVRHRAIRSLGYHSLSAGGMATAVTPTALCAASLLAPGTRGVPREQLDAAIAVIGRATRASGARFVSNFWPDDDTVLVPAEVDRAIELLGRDQAVVARGAAGSQVYVAEGQARIRLEYYKNTLIQHIVGPALTAMVLRTLRLQREGPFALDALRDAGRFVTSLVRLLFVAHAGTSADEIIERSLRQLVELGLVRRDERQIEIDAAGLPELNLLAGLVEGPIEAYRAAARELLLLRAGPRRRKALEQLLVERLHGLHLTGDLRRYESCQTPLASVVIDWLIEEGILDQSGDPQDLQVALARQHQHGEALEVLVERATRLLIAS